MTTLIPAPNTPCPCGSDQPYGQCCGPYHRGVLAPPDAERLMRSRYCAYVLGDGDYLRATWHPDTCPADLDLDQEPRPKWLGLQVKHHETQGPDAARVAFVARYKIAGRAYRLEENSRFVRLNGRWLYVDGDLKD